MPVTATGTDEPVVVPLPSWPELLEPQHETVPSDPRAQTLVRRAATAVAFEIPDTTTGVDELVVVPFHICERTARMVPLPLAVPGVPSRRRRRPDLTDACTILPEVGVLTNDCG